MGNSKSKKPPSSPPPAKQASLALQANQAVTSQRPYSDSLFFCYEFNKLLQFSARQRKAIKHYGSVIIFFLRTLEKTPDNEHLFVVSGQGY
jgi:hypothetical protein